MARSVKRTNGPLMTQVCSTTLWPLRSLVVLQTICETVPCESTVMGGPLWQRSNNGAFVVGWAFTVEKRIKLQNNAMPQESCLMLNSGGSNAAARGLALIVCMVAVRCGNVVLKVARIRRAGNAWATASIVIVLNSLDYSAWTMLIAS